MFDKTLRPVAYHQLTVQVTLESMPWYSWITEVIFNRQGLKAHARESNK